VDNYSDYIVYVYSVCVCIYMWVYFSELCEVCGGRGVVICLVWSRFGEWVVDALGCRGLFFYFLRSVFIGAGDLAPRVIW
jgi:hypothetical protein